MYRYDGEQFALKTIPKAGPASLAGQHPTQKGMGIWERKVRDEVSLHFALRASLDIVTLHDAFEAKFGRPVLEVSDRLITIAPHSSFDHAFSLLSTPPVFPLLSPLLGAR